MVGTNVSQFSANEQIIECGTYKCYKRINDVYCGDEYHKRYIEPRHIYSDITDIYSKKNGNTGTIKVVKVKAWL